MPISDRVYDALRVMDTSSTTEGHAIADCLRSIMENEDIDAADLIASAIELSGWAQFFIKAVHP